MSKKSKPVTPSVEHGGSIEGPTELTKSEANDSFEFTAPAPPNDSGSRSGELVELELPKWLGRIGVLRTGDGWSGSVAELGLALFSLMVCGLLGLKDHEVGLATGCGVLLVILLHHLAGHWFIRHPDHRPDDHATTEDPSGGPRPTGRRSSRHHGDADGRAA